MDMPVCLGEIRTDAQGRLIVLGEYGKAGTCDATKRIRNATDNDGWYDDVADDPVTARIILPDGRVVAAAPAWVVVAPPDFAPGLASVATQFDVLFDRAVRNGLHVLPEPPSFRHDILSILNRIAAIQWVDRLTFRKVQTSVPKVTGRFVQHRILRRKATGFPWRRPSLRAAAALETLCNWTRSSEGG